MRIIFPGELTVKWQPILLAALMILAVLTAGCTEDEPPAVAPPLSSDVMLPGQELVSVGDITGDGIAGGTIDTITFTVALAPGVKSVDMERFSIFYADTIRTESLIPVAGYHGDPPTGCWGIQTVNNEIGAPNNRLEDKEQAVIKINPKAYLPAKRMVTIVVRTPTGTTPLTLRRVAPPTILAQGNILTPP